MEKLPDLTVIVPAFNEEDSLSGVVETLLDTLERISERHGILIIDDGSTDETPRIADDLSDRHETVKVIHHPFNLGFGAAQKSGFLHARTEYVTLVPADNQFKISDLKKFVPKISSADIVLGVRVNREHDSFFRRMKTGLFGIIMRLFFGVNLRDINWVKLFRR